MHLGPGLCWVGLLSSLLLAAYQLEANPVVSSYTVTCPASDGWVWLQSRAWLACTVFMSIRLSLFGWWRVWSEKYTALTKGEAYAHLTGRLKPVCQFLVVLFLGRCSLFLGRPSSRRGVHSADLGCVRQDYQELARQMLLVWPGWY